MRRLLLILMCMTLLFLSGCYDMKEVSDELYAIVLAVDKTDSGILLTAAVPEYGSTEENITELYSADAKDMSEGLNKLNLLLSRKISLLHLKAVIFSEELAREGLYDHAGTIQKHMETRNAMGVMVSKGRADGLLKQLCDSSSGNIASETELLMLSERYNSVYPVILFEDFYNNMKSGYRSAAAVYGNLGDDVICGIALFDGGTMTGSFDERESAFYMIASGKLKGGMIPFETDYGTVSAEVKCEDAKISVDSSVKISVHLRGWLEQNEYDDIEFLENEMEKQIKSGIISAVRKANACGCDILGFNGYAAKEYMLIRDWERNSADYDNLIVNVELELSKSVNG